MSINLEKIPLELRRLPRWILWKLEQRDGKNTKIPYATSGTFASVTDPKTWTTFEKAYAEYQNSFDYDGLGCIIAPPYVGIDLDKCRNPKTGEVEPWAQEALKELNSYTELSPSGAGFHVWVRGSIPQSGNRTGRIEIYQKDRYFTVTGEHVSGTLQTISDRDLISFHQRHILSKAPTEAPKDTSLSAKEFKLLCDIWKQCGADTSENDIILKFFSKAEYREKWERNKQYIMRSVLSAKNKVFKTSTGSSKRLVVIDGSDIKLRNIEWLWKPFLARKELTVFAGLPDTGKGTVTADIVSRITSHTAFPGEPVYALSQDEVLIFSAEESHDTTTIPRIIAARGDSKKVKIAKGTEINLQDKTSERVVSLLADISEIRDTLKQHPKVSLIVIDPIDCYFGGGKKNSTEDATAIYGSLKKIADDFNVSILIVDHLNKDSDKAAIHRISGAGAAGARPRLAWVFGKDKLEQNIRHIVCLKGNILTEEEKRGRKFFLKSVFIEIDGKPSSQSCVEWDGDSNLSAEEVLSPPDLKERDRDKAEKFLRELRVLTPSAEIFSMAASLGISSATLNRAKKDLRMESTQRGREWYFVPLRSDYHKNEGETGNDLSDCQFPDTPQIDNLLTIASQSIDI